VAPEEMLYEGGTGSRCQGPEAEPRTCQVLRRELENGRRGGRDREAGDTDRQREMGMGPTTQEDREHQC
jgi:hypothetical protein